MISEFDKVQTYWPTFTFHYKYKNFKKDKSDLIKDIYKESSKQEKDIDSGVAEAAKYNLLESKLSFLYTDTTSIKKVKDFFYEEIHNLINLVYFLSLVIFHLDPYDFPILSNDKPISYNLPYVRQLFL